MNPLLKQIVDQRIDPAGAARLFAAVDAVRMDGAVLDYVMALVGRTRSSDLIDLGVERRIVEKRKRSVPTPSAAAWWWMWRRRGATPS